MNMNKEIVMDDSISAIDESDLGLRFDEENLLEVGSIKMQNTVQEMVRSHNTHVPHIILNDLLVF